MFAVYGVCGKKFMFIKWWKETKRDVNALSFHENVPKAMNFSSQVHCSMKWSNQDNSSDSYQCRRHLEECEGEYEDDCILETQLGCRNFEIY